MAKQQEEKYEAKMKLLNDRVSHDLPLTEAEWAAWRKWIVLWEEEEEEEEEGASTSSWGADTFSLFVVWCLYDAFHAVFPLVVGRPEMLGIMAGTYQKDSCALLMCQVGFAGDSAPRAVFFPCRQAQDALHHGRYGSEGLLPGGAVPAGGGTGSARRRRERRLRSMLRHERMSVAMALADPRTVAHSARRRQGPGERHELYFTATFRRRLSPRVPGHPVWVSRGGHRNGSSSALWSSSPTSCPWSRFWIFLCRSWRNSWWWKCRRSFPILPYSGLWSSTSTFQFLIVEGETLIFKVFSQTEFNRAAWFSGTHFSADCGAVR